MEKYCLLLGIIWLLTFPEISARENPRNVQLATSYQKEVNVKDFWVSEKLDGVRGYWDGKQMFSRGGHPIYLPRFFIKNWPSIPLEGELWINRGKFEAIASIVQKHHAKEKEWRQVKFMLFDMPKHKGSFSARITAMKDIIINTNNHHLQMIEQYRVSSNEQLTALFNSTVAEGGEGLMLHKANSLYRQGRSASVMKLKPFFDEEAEVIAHISGKGKYLNKLGAIKVKNSAGKIFKIGSGFSNQERENPPPIGSIITYKYSGKTRKGVPRFATYLRIRNLAKAN